MNATAQPGAKQGTQPLSILDGVCVLYFAASGKTSLLVNILTAANYVILLPREVLGECEKKARRNGWDISNLYPALGGRIRLLSEINATQPVALRKLTQIRQGHPKGMQGSANLGECVCITHALGAKSQGLKVAVAMDDADGQSLADANGVSYFTIEDAFIAGVDNKVITRAQARTAYMQMVPFGSSLPSWAASELKSRLDM